MKGEQMGWDSLREAGAGGSNPLTPTNIFNDLAGFCTCAHCYGKHIASTQGGILVISGRIRRPWLQIHIVVGILWDLGEGNTP